MKSSKICDVLGFKAGGTVSNITVSMFVWMAQFADVLLHAVSGLDFVWRGVQFKLQDNFVTN